MTFYRIQQQRVKKYCLCIIQNTVKYFNINFSHIPPSYTYSPRHTCILSERSECRVVSSAASLEQFRGSVPEVVGRSHPSVSAGDRTGDLSVIGWPLSLQLEPHLLKLSTTFHGLIWFDNVWTKAGVTISSSWSQLHLLMETVKCGWKLENLQSLKRKILISRSAFYFYAQLGSISSADTSNENSSRTIHNTLPFRCVEYTLSCQIIRCTKLQQQPCNRSFLQGGCNVQSCWILEVLIQLCTHFQGCSLWCCWIISCYTETTSHFSVLLY